jgi:hypothetical protein
MVTLGNATMRAQKTSTETIEDDAPLRIKLRTHILLKLQYNFCHRPQLEVRAACNIRHLIASSRSSSVAVRRGPHQKQTFADRPLIVGGSASRKTRNGARPDIEIEYSYAIQNETTRRKIVSGRKLLDHKVGLNLATAN